MKLGNIGKRLTVSVVVVPRGLVESQRPISLVSVINRRFWILVNCSGLGGPVVARAINFVKLTPF